MTPTLAAQPLHARGSLRPTLQALVVDAWDSVAAGAEAECPVCAGPMQPRSLYRLLVFCRLQSVRPF